MDCLEECFRDTGYREVWLKCTSDIFATGNSNLSFRKIDSEEEIHSFYKILCDNLKKIAAVPVHSLEELLEFKEGFGTEFGLNKSYFKALLCNTNLDRVVLINLKQIFALLAFMFLKQLSQKYAKMNRYSWLRIYLRVKKLNKQRRNF